MGDAAIQTENPSKQNINKEKALIFIHTYKTAGSTLHDIFWRQFPQNAAFYFAGGSSQEEVQENTELLRRLSKKGRPRIRCIWGAPFFGLHKYLCQPSVYVTFLRDPVDRVISEYYHVLRGTGNNELVSKNISLEDYVRNGTWLSWNAQVRFLKGAPEGSWPAYGPIPLSTDDLEMAKTNLRQNFILGLGERFDESLILLKRSLGWRTIDILYVKRRVGRNRPPKDRISHETVKLIEEHNELDIKLYQFAKQMFEERISQQDSSFRREVQILRLLNKFYGLTIIRALVLLLALLRGKLQISDVYHIVYNYNRVMMGKVKAATRKQR